MNLDLTNFADRKILISAIAEHTTINELLKNANQYCNTFIIFNACTAEINFYPEQHFNHGYYTLQRVINNAGFNSFTFLRDGFLKLRLVNFVCQFVYVYNTYTGLHNLQLDYPVFSFDYALVNKYGGMTLLNFNLSEHI